MSKKVKTPKPTSNNNINLQQQPTNVFLDGRGELVLSNSSLASAMANCSSMFRPTNEFLYQINHKNEFEDIDVNRNPSFPISGDKDVVHPPESSHSEISKDHQYRPSSTDRSAFTPGNSISSDITLSSSSVAEIRTMHFGSNSPGVSPAIILGHLQTNSFPFPDAVTAVLSPPRPVDLGISRRPKLLHSFVDRSSNIVVGNSFSAVNNVANGSNNVINFSNNNVDNNNQALISSQGNLFEIKKEPTYMPQVEAISPTGSGDEMSQSDNETIRQSKDEILQNITKLDRLISSLDQKVAKMKKYQEHLEERSSRPPKEKVEKPAPVVDLSKLGIAHSIYSENRSKAVESHMFLKIHGVQLALPLYHKPSDAQVYHDNIKKFATFKPLLITYIKKRKQFVSKRDIYLCQKYDRLSESWVERMDKVENNPKKRIKDAKTREIFEKVFPELRRKREEKERLTKLTKKSENDSSMFPEEELKMRMSAAEPTMMLDPLTRKRSFLSENGRIMDNFDLTQLLPGIKKYYWTKSESDIFRETYVTNPKNFARIASLLQNKSIQECVYFYYITKKEEGYKQLVRKHNMSRRKHDKAKKAHSHKEIKEEKVEEQEETKDIKFLPSSPSYSSSSLLSSLFTYNFKLPNYLLLPSSGDMPTDHVTSSSSSSSPLAASTTTSSTTILVQPMSPLTPPPSSFPAIVKQELDLDVKPILSSSLSSPFLTSSSSSPLLTSSSSSSVMPMSAHPSMSSSTLSLPSLLSSAFVPASSFHSIHPSNRLQAPLIYSQPSSVTPGTLAMSSPAVPSSEVAIVAVSQLANHYQQQSSLPHPLHVGGSIVQGTPVVTNHANDLAVVQQFRLHFLQQQLQQQFHQQRQMQQQEQLTLLQPNPAMPLAGQDLQVLVNQLAANQQVQEMRGSIIKGTPNHMIVRETSSNSIGHTKSDSTASSVNRSRQDRNSPANNHSSPKRGFVGKQKAPSRAEGGLPTVSSAVSVMEESNGNYEQSRDVLIDDYMTAQKMKSSVPPPSSNTSCEQPIKKQLPVPMKRKAPASSSLSQSGEGLIYFAGGEIPKSSLPNVPQVLASTSGGDSARAIIDNIIGQSIEGDRGPQKNPNTVITDGARPSTSSRPNVNFQPPTTLPPQFFSPSSSNAAALQSAMMLKSLSAIFPPFLPVGSFANLPMLQHNFPHMFPSPIPTSADKAPSSTNKNEPSSFISPPPPALSLLSSRTSCATTLTNSNNTRSSNDNIDSSSKNNVRSSLNTLATLVNVPNNIYGNIYNFISAAHNQPPPPPSSSSSSSQPPLFQLPPPLTSPPLLSHINPPPLQSSSSSLPSTFHAPSSPASFLPIFPLGQFMPPLSSFSPQTPLTLSTSSSRQHTSMPAFVPSSSLLMTQLIQNIHQFSSSSTVAMPTAAIAAALKPTSTTSGHS